MDERLHARDMLDLQEGTGPVAVLDREGALEVLRRTHRIAMVGASPDPGRPSHGVMRYLQHHGFECVPVNPTTRDVLGVRSHRTLEEAVAETGPFDLVDVFRRPEHTPAIARSAVATRCAIPLAAAGRRELGSGAHRSGSGSRCRDGPLHGNGPPTAAQSL